MRPGLIVCGVFALVFMIALSNAANIIQIDVGRYGQSGTVDTIYVGGHYELRFWIENDFVLGGFIFTYEIWSDDGVTWRYISRPEGIGNSGYFTIVPDSRMEDDPFDMTGVLVLEYDIDMEGTDILNWGGVAVYNGLQPGPSEHMVSMHFSPTGPWDPDEVHTLCFDTCLIPPPDPWLWTDLQGNIIVPEWGGQLCLPVKLICGNPNGDNDVNVGDCVFMINYVFRGGPAPEPWQLGDANCDGVLDVGDVVFLIAASFHHGPQPECCEY